MYSFKCIKLHLYKYLHDAGLPTIFHIFAHAVPIEERSRAFGYLVAMGSIGQTVSALVSDCDLFRCLSCYMIHYIHVCVKVRVE